MNHFQDKLRAPALWAAFAILPVRFDDPKHAHEDVPLPLPGASADANDPHTEMKRLFGKIEQDLREIDRLLADASAGGRGSAGAVEEKSAHAAQEIGKLLETSESRGRDVLAGIDRILELACHEPTNASSCQSAGGLCKSAGQSSQSSSSESRSSGSKQEPGEGESGGSKSPLDRQGGNTTDREATPQAPEKTAGAGEKESGGDGSKKEAGTPRGDQASSSAAHNNPARPPAGSAKGEPQSGASPIDRWGELPVHVRDVFRAQGGGDMPAQYRDWIDAYYRRMARRSGS